MELLQVSGFITTDLLNDDRVVFSLEAAGYSTDLYCIFYDEREQERHLKRQITMDQHLLTKKLF